MSRYFVLVLKIKNALRNRSASGILIVTKIVAYLVFDMMYLPFMVKTLLER